jgi:hypothetical protein
MIWEYWFIIGLGIYVGILIGAWFFGKYLGDKK